MNHINEVIGLSQQWRNALKHENPYAVFNTADIILVELDSIDNRLFELGFADKYTPNEIAEYTEFRDVCKTQIPLVKGMIRSRANLN